MTNPVIQTATEKAKERGYSVFPGFCDVHVHFREPGFSYKETIKTGCMAAARGGFTAVCPMPNLDPVPDNLDMLKVEQDIIARDASIYCLPYASITRGENGKELSDFDALAPYVAAFTDDGRGVADDDLLREAMTRAKKLGKLIVQHCEDAGLSNGGWIHDGAYARLHGHRGIPSESEWKQAERDIKLAQETGCSYHICHVSCAGTVELVRKAKAEGIDVTCEVTPNNLLMNDMMLEEDGRFPMTPPLRSESDRLALIDGVADGTIDMIITDHAPHSSEEKSNGLEKSLFGVVGLETVFPLLYTYLVKEDVISLDRLLVMMTTAPRKRFNIEADPGICVWDLNDEYAINPADFLSMGRATPFRGKKVFGRCITTIYDGNTVYEYK